MNTKILVIVLVVLIFTQSKPLKLTKIIKAINCGLKQGTTKGDGQYKYDNDQGIVSGSSVDVDYHSDSGASSNDIKYTIQKEIYMFQRHTYSKMTYSLPVKTGKHTIILKFAEMYFQKPGQRVFNIQIGDNVVIQNMDVIQKSGSKYSAHEEYIQIQVKDAAVYFNNNKIKNGLKGGNLQLSFAKGKADNPIIQGIVVYHGPVQETTKQDYESLKKNWGSHQQMLKAKKQNEKVKQLIAMTKKKQKITIRNDQLLIQQEQGQNQQSPKRQKFGFMRSFLMSPIGIIIWAAVIGYFIYFVYNRVFLFGKLTNIEEIKQQ